LPRAGTAASGVVPPRAGLHSNPPRLLHGWRACRVVAVRVAARALCALLIDDVVLQLDGLLFNGLPVFEDERPDEEGGPAQSGTTTRIDVVRDSENESAVETRGSTAASSVLQAFNATCTDPLQSSNMFGLVEQILAVHLRQAPDEFVAARTLPREVHERLLRRLHADPVKERDDLRFDAPREIATDPADFYRAAAVHGSAEHAALAEIVGASADGPSTGSLRDDELTSVHVDCHSAAMHLYHFRHATAMLSRKARQPSGGAALNILSYVPMPADLLQVKGIYRVKRLNALAQVMAHKKCDPTILRVVLHEGSELDVSASEWYAQDGPHDLFEKPPTPTHEKCTKDKKKLEELKKHAERWLAAYESAELYRKAENQAPDAAHIPQEDEDELEDGDLEVEIVSDDSF